MEIDKVFSSDVDGVADNLFSAVKNSVSEIKAMQQRKAAENVQLVIQALKKIESDLQDKFDGVTTVIEKRVATIKDGRDGLDGRNGRDGKDGRPGRDGAPGARGPAGVPGTNGRDGEDGVSVTDAKIDFDGSLIISLSSGREINVGEVVAPDLAEKIKVITNGGGTSQSVLDTLASLQAQITAISSLGAVNYVGTWNASTNSPTITSGSGDKGDYYVVSVAGSTNIDGQTLWGVGDWIIFNGTAWQKVDGGSTGDFTTLSASGTVTFTGLNASQAVFTNGSDELVSNAITGTGNVVMSASPTLTGTASLAALTTSSTVTHNGGTANGVAYLNGSKVLTTGSALTFDGTTLTNVAPTGLAAVFERTNAPAVIGIKYNGAVGGYLGAASTGALTWYSDAGSELMRLTSTGLGIGTSSPSYKLHVAGTGGFANNGNENLFLIDTSGSTRSSLQISGATNYFNANIDSASHGQYVWRSSNAYTERMRLDSSGNLGIGTSSPNAKLAVVGGGIRVNGYSGNSAGDGVNVQIGTTGGVNYLQSLNGTGTNDLSIDANQITFRTGSFATTATFDSSGNLGLGVTPSASQANGVLFLKNNGQIAFSGPVSYFDTNIVYNSGADRYIANGTASRIAQLGGSFQFLTAPSGNANDTISFTQALTLDASGNLLLGGTSAGASSAASLAIFNGTAPTGSVTNGIILYAEDVSSSSELKVRDEAGNVTTLSPHNFSLIPDGPSEDMAWAYYSEKGGKRINVDMLKLARMVEKLTGEKLVYES